MIALIPLFIAGCTSFAALQLTRSYLPVEGAAALAAAAVLSYAAFVGMLLCLPLGQPVVRRAWHLGALLTHGWRATA
jgi:hypothetical protein